MTLSQITVVASAIEKQRSGYQAVSLTNYDNNSEPQIAAGSELEIGGALFEATANESITGWGGISLNSDAYIKTVPSGAIATAEFTTTAPTWSTSKQGWYDGLARYIFALSKDGSGNYAAKRLLNPAPASRLSPGQIVLPFMVATGSTQMWAADVEVMVGNLAYYKSKEIYIPVSGVLNVYFEMHGTGGSIVYGRIYKNGVAVGTERSSTSETYVSFSEDITVAAGDRLQLFGKSSSTSWMGYHRYFRLRSGTAVPAESLLALLPVIMKDD